MARLNETFPLFDYDELQGFSEDVSGLFCLSQRDISLIHGAMRMIDWPSRWVGSDGVLLRDSGRDVELDEAIAFASRIAWRLSMSNCEDLATILSSVAAGGGGGSCGCGTTGTSDDEPAAPIDTGDPGACSSPPPDFADCAEYITYKCDMADHIVGGSWPMSSGLRPKTLSPSLRWRLSLGLLRLYRVPACWPFLRYC